MQFEGRVEAIHIAAESGAPLTALARVRAVAGKGLEGDRNFGATHKGEAVPQDALTLIEAESIEAVARDLGIELAPGETRRNLTTRGVPLNHLVGQRFRVGGAVALGYELCEPCKHLESLTNKSLIKPLLHRGGLRAYIVEDGEIEVGAAIVPL